jgi:hypothetical protein
LSWTWEELLLPRRLSACPARRSAPDLKVALLRAGSDRLRDQKTGDSRWSSSSGARITRSATLSSGSSIERLD